MKIARNCNYCGKEYTTCHENYNSFCCVGCTVDNIKHNDGDYNAKLVLEYMKVGQEYTDAVAEGIESGDESKADYLADRLDDLWKKMTEKDDELYDIICKRLRPSKTVDDILSDLKIKK